MGNSVNLTFSHFEMEDHYGSGNCSYDFLSVKDVGARSELGKFCGSEVPERISSSSDTVLVHFQSDYSVAHNGFRLGKEEGEVVGSNCDVVRVGRGGLWRDSHKAERNT